MYRHALFCAQIAALGLVASLLGPTAGIAQTNETVAIRFTEDAQALGLSFENTDAESVAWVDYNGDGWQDLWLSAHWMWTRFYRSKLYLNQAGQTFTNQWPALHATNFRTDAHASSWLDIDNDGDTDLFVVGGGQSGRRGEGDPNLLFQQHEGKLWEASTALGLANPQGRGRLAFWFDGNNDGLLDLLLANATRADGLPSRNRLFYQHKDGRFNPAQELPPEQAKTRAGQLFMAPGDLPDWMASSVGTAGQQSLWLAKAPRRVASGDFDGDGILDHIVYTPSRLVREICQARGKDGSIIAYLPPQGGHQRHFSFRSEGPLGLHINASPSMRLYRGASSEGEDFRSLMLSALNDELHSQTPAPAPDNGMRVRYSPQSGRWHIDVQQPPESANAIQFLLQSVLPEHTIKADAPDCRHVSPFRKHPAVIYNGAQGNRKPLVIENFDQALMPGAMLPGDFDNDGRLDLYLERSSDLSDLPDLVLHNLGDGRFRAIEVRVDSLYSGHGLFLKGLIPGPHLAMADYNNDGALDVFLAARYYYSGLENPRNMAGVPNRLLTNHSNTGHWLKLDLVGHTSNRDAIGAKVELQAKGRRWLRYQSGGIDAYDQHSRIVHVGLGEVEQVETLRITWPSGQLTELKALPVDKVLTLVEPTRTERASKEN